MNVICFFGGLFVGSIIGIVFISKFFLKQLDKIKKVSDKNVMLYHMANEWLMKKQEGKNLTHFFLQSGYKRIAVYGMAYMGERFLDELKDSDIEIVYAIDKNATNIYSYIEVIQPDADLKEVDIVVVTSIAFFDEVKDQLAQKLHCPIVALDDIIYNL